MRARVWVPAAFLALALLLLWPLTLHPNFVAFNPHATYSDLIISHLPNAEYIRASLAQFRQVPWWNTALFAGQPLAADPLAGLWYPPNLLLLVLPLPFAFNLLLALHLAWAGGGLYAFLRAEGLDRGPAFLGGLAFAGTPKLLAHLSAGHVSLVCAVAWTPWLLLAIKRAAVEGGLRRGAWAGACLAAVFLADSRWAFFAAALGGAWWLAFWPPFAPRRPGGRLGWAAVGLAVMFLALSAVLILPLAQFTLQTDRGALTLAEAGTYSLPLPYLLGLLVPDPYGFHEYMTYLGLVPLILAFVGLRRQTWFWALAVGVAAVFSLGTHAFLFPLLFRVLPGLSLLRVPPRAWFIVAVGVCVLAAYGAQRLQKGPLAQRRVLLGLLLGLTLLDLVRVSGSLIEARSRPPMTPAAQWLTAQPGLFRVYSPSYSLPPGDGLQHVDGVDPLHLATYARFFEAASGVPIKCYTVTLPPLGPCEPATTDVDPALFNAGARPDAVRLGLLNVKYVAAEFPLEVPGLALVQTFGQTYVYENALVRPRAWVEAGQGAAPGFQPAEVVDYSPNRLRVRATGPGQLVLSEVMYSGWRAQVDGVVAPLVGADDLLRSVTLGPGAHEIVVEFWPVSLYAGMLISALGLVALAAVWRWAR
jgi:hypothetical protein